MSALQPLTNRKLQLRLAIGLFVVAGVYFGWTLISNFLIDPDTGTMNTSGWIAAIEDTKDGSQAVIIKPDGEIVSSPGYAGQATDQSVTWQPDGNRLYFSSDRESGETGFHIYRWNPVHNVVQRRSTGSRSQDRPVFPAEPSVAGEQPLLVISGGLVLSLSPRDGSNRQMLPFVGKNPTTVSSDQGGGLSSQFGPEYDHLGKSFRQADWCGGQKYIVGILVKDTGGETIAVQNMNPAKQSDLMPRPLGTGEHIDYSVSPKDGSVAFTINNWQWPEGVPIPQQFVKNNHVSTPYTSFFGLYSPDTGKLEIVTASSNDKVAFGEPQVSPDGSKVAFVVGPYKDGGITSQALFVCPLAPGAGRAATAIFQGPAYDPHWSPDGSKITFVREIPGSDNDICVINSDGSGFSDLTNGKGNFSDPSFSPQLTKAAD